MLLIATLLYVPFLPDLTKNIQIDTTLAIDNPVPVLYRAALYCIHTHLHASSLHMRDLEQPETPENRPRDTRSKPVKYLILMSFK